MAPALASLKPAASDRFYNRLVLAALVAITVTRSIALFLTPLDLGVDEAQYWLWSQTPDFGYFTKPPLIAWIIGMSHWLFGHHTWAVRLPACWLHLLTALLLWRGTGWLYGHYAGRLSALIWISLPAIGLGSFLISTDTPLLTLWSAGILALCAIASGRLSAAVGMALAGFAFGAAMLAKFAAIYAILGLVIILFTGRFTGKPLFGWRHLGIAFVTFAIAASPNVIWNIAHEFSTVRHLGDNANISQDSASLAGVWQFLGGQFAVAGPLMFALMLIAAKSQWRQHRVNWLIWMSAPALGLMTVQSFLSEANANWAMTAYPALTMLAAGWLADHKNASRWGAFAIGINLVLGLFILIVTMAGTMGPLTPKSDPLRRLRGWQQLAADITPHIAAHNATAVLADRRATASLLSWHFYGTPLTIMVHDDDGVPSNHFEANHSWSPQPGRRLIALDGLKTAPPIAGIGWMPFTAETSTRISHNRTRNFTIFRGIE